jgi:AraC-like DNA-binding protein
LDLISVLVTTRTAGSDDHIRPDRGQQALLLIIQNFIEQHLDDPDLDPAAIAAAHHISVRSLYRLFSSHQMTVAGWVRARRLDRCRQDLSDPRLRQRPVHVIGIRWGLSDSAHFSRVFKAAFGLTPNDYRARQSEIGGTDLARGVNRLARSDNPSAGPRAPDLRRCVDRR